MLAWPLMDGSREENEGEERKNEWSECYGKWKEEESNDG